MLFSRLVFHGLPPLDNHQDFPENIVVQMGGVLRYQWEAYCDTNGRSTEVFPFPESSMAPKAMQYKLEVYCNTFLRRRAQRLKNFKIALWDFNFQARLKISSEPPTKPLFLVGNSKRQPNHDHDHFWAHLAGPHFSFSGYPQMPHQMPLLHSGTQRKH